MKLYPWEWLINEEYGKYIFKSTTQFIEPAWKMILSNKGILPLLWELFPEHPNLLPAYFTSKIEGDYIKKPLLSREGANISIFKDGEVTSSEGDYGEEGFIYQALHELPNFDGNHPMVGSWVIEGESAGIGIREDTSLITGNLSRFVPHYFIP
jgi:glutathionylspermidine synthase